MQEQNRKNSKFDIKYTKLKESHNALINHNALIKIYKMVEDLAVCLN